MELKTFVTETLNQIIDGVKDAQKNSAQQGGEVNPPIFTRPDKGQDRLQHMDIASALVQEVSFDVAVTAVEGTQTKGGIGVFIGVVGLGSQGQSNTSTQSVSRIKFSVPIMLPSSKR